MGNTEDKSQERGLHRRELLKVIGTAVPAALIPQAAAAAELMKIPLPRATAPDGTETAGTYELKALGEHEYETIRHLSDLIIPADERSGSATQAGVPEFIDDWLDLKDGEIKAAIRGGLIWLDAECNRQFSHDFVDCTEAQRKQILDRIAYPKQAKPEDLAGVAFFNHLRNLVVSGFFSSEMGVKDLPYLGNQMFSEWNGCPSNVLARLGLK